MAEMIDAHSKADCQPNFGRRQFLTGTACIAGGVAVWGKAAAAQLEAGTVKPVHAGQYVIGRLSQGSFGPIQTVGSALMQANHAPNSLYLERDTEENVVTSFGGLPGDLVGEVYTSREGGVSRPVILVLTSTDGRSEHRDRLDPTLLSAFGDALVIRVACRGAAAGWAYLAEMKMGNAALSDAIAALDWVQAHAVSFGGDAGNVTIVAEQNANALVLAVLGAPLASGKFHKAVMTGVPKVSSIDSNLAGQMSEMLKAELDIDIDADLLAIEPARLAAAYSSVTDNLGPLQFAPVVDGKLLHDDAKLAAQRSSSSVPLMVGLVSDAAISDQSTMKEVAAEWGEDIVGQVDKIYQSAYGENDKSSRAAFASEDKILSLQIVPFASDWHERAGAPAYVFDARGAEALDRLTHVVGAFARSGRPQTRSGKDIPAYTGKHSQVVRLTREAKVAENSGVDAAGLWANLSSARYA